jgi:hypothetical protein
MAVRYPKQLVGVTDGTLIPAKPGDGRQIGAFSRTSIFSKVTGTEWAIGDTIPLGIKPAGHTVTSIKLCTGTSLGSATIDVGITGAVDKYVDGATLTVVNRATEIGVIAATLDDDPGAEEELFATVGVAAIVAGTVLSFIVETTGYN